MLEQTIRDAWSALARSRTRSALTVAGIVWGIVAVTLLIAYGSGFRTVLLRAFDAFGKSTVILWPAETSEQPGGQRAGKKVVLEQQDLERVRATATLVRVACLETVKTANIATDDRLVNTAIRGVCPEYGEMRNEVPKDGRWLNAADEQERRHVAFLGARVKEKLFGGMPAVGRTVRIMGQRFTVIGVMDRKIQMSNYFTSDDESVWIPYSAAGDLWDTKYAKVMVFSPVAPRFEKQAEAQVLAALAARQNFSPTDKKAVQMFGREEFRPIIEALGTGLEGLLLFIGALTLGIGGVGVMNIMLVSVDERTREIGLRRALGATRRDVQRQVLAEVLLITLAGGALGMALAWLLSLLLPTLPLLGPLFEDTSGQGDIRLALSWTTLALSTAVLMLVGVLSSLLPARRAAGLDPVVALRHE